MPDLDVTLAGAVSLRRGDRRVGERAFGARQLRLVTAMLVLERDGPVSVDLLADQLWPDQPPTQWKVAVRGLVSQFRRRLVDLGLGSDSVVGDQGRYVLDLGEVRVDLEAAAHDVADGRHAVDAGAIERASLLAGSARSVLSRPVLSGVESDWLDRLRDRVARDHLESLVLLGECRRRLDAPADARRVLAEAIGIDPLREDAWRALMRAEAAAGNVARALAAYEDCRRRLADELGVDPAEETQRLHAELLQGVPDPEVSALQPPPAADLSSTTANRDLEPYVGLRAFTVAEADRFFGRDAEVQALVDRLARHGIVAVVGPSGVGKSSLVRAGLLPALDRGAIPDADTWLPVVMTPTAAPAKTLAAELAEGRPGVDQAAMRDAVAGGSDGLHDAAGLVLADAPSTARVLLVVDQFEELFTLGTTDRAEAFVGLLTAATGRLDRRVVVVVTLRADFYDRAADVAGMADLLSHSQFVVPPLEGDQVEAAIVGPARHVGVSLEPGLLGRIVADVAGEPGSLPLLQHLLYELWEHRVDRVLTRGSYDDLGGVSGALAHRAEQVYVGLEREERAVARRVLLRAVQPGEDGGDARRPVPEDELHGPGDDPEKVDAVVDRLVDARLLTAGQEAPGEGRTLEIAHEALIDGWPRLRGWVDEARGWLLDHRRLTFAAQEWVAHDRQDDWLLGGTPLDEAHGLVLADGRGDIDLHLSPAEHELVQASLDARDLVRTWEAEREQHRRDLERRSASRLRVLVAFVVGVALVATGLWWNARRDARAGLAREFAAQSRDVVDDDAQLALLLALESQSILGAGAPGSDEAASALHAAIAANRVAGRHLDVGDVIGIVPERQLMVAARREVESDGSWTVDVRDITTGDAVSNLGGHEGNAPVSYAVATPDEAVLALGTVDGVVHLWDWEDERERGRLDLGEDEVLHAMSFSPDGRYLAATAGVFSGSPVVVWDVASGEVVWTSDPADLSGTADTAPLAEFHPDGRRLAVLYPGADIVRTVSTDTWREEPSDMSVPGAHTMAWSPDGRRLALAGTELVVRDARSGEPVQVVRPFTHDGGRIAWSPDSTRVAVGSEPVTVWALFDEAGAPVEPGEPLELRGGTLRCADAVFDPRGASVWEYSYCGDGFRAWDLGDASRTEVAWLPGSPSYQMGVDWSPDGARLAAPRGEGDLVVWSTESWEPVHIESGAHSDGDWDPPIPRIINLDWSADGTSLVTAGLDDVALWNTDAWEAVRVGRGGYATATIAPSSDVFAHAAWTRDLPEDDRKLVWVRDLEGSELAVLEWGEDLWVEDLDFSPDGRFVAAAVYDQSGLSTTIDSGVLVWEWEEGEMVGFLETEATPASVDWHPGGDRILLASQRPMTRAEVWDVGDIVRGTAGVVPGPGHLVATMDGHQDWLQEAVYDLPGQRAATCSGDGTVRLWDADTGRELQRLVHGSLSGLCRLRFSPDGTRLAITDSGHGTRILALPVDDLAAVARSRLARTWSDPECREYLGLESCPD